MSIEIHLTRETNRSDLGMTPLSVAQRAAIWQSLKDLMAVPVPLHGNYYTISLEFLDYKTFSRFDIWCAHEDMTNPIHIKRQIFIGFSPEYILDEEKWINYVLPSILNKNLWEETGQRLMEEGCIVEKAKKITREL